MLRDCPGRSGGSGKHVLASRRKGQNGENSAALIRGVGGLGGLGGTASRRLRRAIQSRIDWRDGMEARSEAKGILGTLPVSPFVIARAFLWLSAPFHFIDKPREIPSGQASRGTRLMCERKLGEELSVVRYIPTDVFSKKYGEYTVGPSGKSLFEENKRL